LIQDAPELIEKTQLMDYNKDLDRVLGDAALWGMDLAALPGLAETVRGYLQNIETKGMREAIADICGS